MQRQDNLSSNSNKLRRAVRSPHLVTMVLTILLAVQVAQNQLILRGWSSEPITHEPIIIGRQISPVTLYTADGAEFSTSRLTANYHLLIFFDTRCQYCIFDLPLWRKMQQQATKSGVDLIAVTAETDAAAVNRYAEKKIKLIFLY